MLRAFRANMPSHCRTHRHAQTHVTEWDVADVEIHTRAEKAAVQLGELSRHIDMIARCHFDGCGCCCCFLILTLSQFSSQVR